MKIHVPISNGKKAKIIAFYTMSFKKGQRLNIVLSNPTVTYNVGDLLSGHVHLDLLHGLRIKGIKVHLYGAAKVAWQERRAYTKGSSSTKEYRNNDVFLDEMITLYSSNDMMAAGRYSWPFSMRLPMNLPSSFDGQWGKVQYAAIAIVEKSWKGNAENSRTFIVNGMLDLNTEPDVQNPTEHEVEGMSRVACFKSGAMSGRLRLQRKGYAIGQKIPFIAKIDNNSKRHIIVRLNLVQQTVFRANKTTRKSSITVQSMTKGELLPGQQATWEAVMTDIPVLPPSRLGANCKSIDVRYFLTLTMSPSGIGGSVSVPVEIIVGTVALHDSYPTNTTPSDRRRTSRAQRAGISTAGAVGHK